MHGQTPRLGTDGKRVLLIQMNETVERSGFPRNERRRSVCKLARRSQSGRKPNRPVRMKSAIGCSG